MDIPLMVPFQAVSEAGDIQPELGLEITSNLVISFFDRHLKQKSNEIQSLTYKYDELILNSFEIELVKN